MAKQNTDNALSIKAMIQSLMTQKIGLLVGTVTSTAPLQISADTDSKLIIGPDNVFIPKHLTDYKVKIDLSAGKGAGLSGKTEKDDALDSFALQNVEVTVHNALQIGDKVHVLAVSDGKQYFVLDRVG